MSPTATDLFSGAGGTSLGATAAGVEIVMAANHWQTAIDVHQVHHPDAAHDCADISQADPRRYPRTDVLLAGPECTNHSQARGVSRKRQDPTLWDAPDPATDRWSLVDAEQLVDDCGFRMLEPYEIAAAMAFPDGYIPRDLTKRDQVKLAGNAVTPPVMTWITGRVLQALEAAG